MCADYYRHFSVGVRLLGKLAGPWVTELMASRRTTWQQLIDAGEDDAAEAVGVDFDWSIEDGSLYLTDNGESGNVEHVADLLRELIRLGYVQEPVAIHWADSCSRSRPDAFTGGAAIVTKKRTYWFLLPELVAKKLETLERRRCAAR